MIKNIKDLKVLIEKLGLFVFVEERESGDYLCVCTSIDADADIYIYKNKTACHMNNNHRVDNIIEMYGIEKFIQVTTLINSYLLSK